MSKNLALATINIGFFIFLGWYIAYTKDMNNIVALVFLIILDVILGVFMTNN